MGARAEQREERRREETVTQALNIRVFGGDDATNVEQIVSGICVTSSGDLVSSYDFPPSCQHPTHWRTRLHNAPRAEGARRFEAPRGGRPDASSATPSSGNPHARTMLEPGAATVASSGAAPSESAEDADVRRTLRYDGAATTAATSSPERRMAMAIPLGDDWMQTLDRATGRCARGSLRRRPRSPFSGFPNNGARRVASNCPRTASPDPLRSPLPPIPSAHLFPRSPPLTSPPSPSHQTVLLQHEDPRGVVGLPRVRGPRDSPGDLPPLR